ncbi:MAG: hypothetical protein R3E76_07840 [Planctomycetota bacterium]
MNDENLIHNASKAAGEPLGDVTDSSELSELTNAVAVLKSSTLEHDPRRIRELEEQTADQARIVHLGHFAAAAVVFFCIGLVVLFKVGFTPPENPLPIAGENKPTPETTVPANKQDPPQQVYERPAWITQQATVVANTKVNEVVPSPGGIGMGGGTGGGGTGSAGAAGSRYAFTVFKPAHAPPGMKLKRRTMLRGKATDTGFDLFRQEFEGNGRVLLVLQAAESPESTPALSSVGLPGNAFSFVRDGTVVLLLSNSLATSELETLAATMVELR